MYHIARAGCEISSMPFMDALIEDQIFEYRSATYQTLSSSAWWASTMGIAAQRIRGPWTRVSDKIYNRCDRHFFKS
jgi:hypothetical protein